MFSHSSFIQTQLLAARPIIGYRGGYCYHFLLSFFLLGGVIAPPVLVLGLVEIKRKLTSKGF